MVVDVVVVVVVEVVVVVVVVVDVSDWVEDHLESKHSDGKSPFSLKQYSPVGSSGSGIFIEYKHPERENAIRVSYYYKSIVTCMTTIFISQAIKIIQVVIKKVDLIIASFPSTTLTESEV